MHIPWPSIKRENRRNNSNEITERNEKNRKDNNTGWLKLKVDNGNVFPGQRQRHFFESDREILRTFSMSPYEDLTRNVLFFFAWFFGSEDYLENLDLLETNIFGEKKKNEGQAS